MSNRTYSDFQEYADEVLVSRSACDHALKLFDLKDALTKMSCVSGNLLAIADIYSEIDNTSARKINKISNNIFDLISELREIENETILKIMAHKASLPD